MNNMNELVALGEKNVMNTYSRFPVALEKGDGAYVWDINGKKYVDFVAGIAVNALGHNHPKLVKTISEQVTKLIHVSNLYYTAPQIELASLLTKYTDFDKVFFCNSGAEANESALKLCRKYADMKGKPGAEIITMLKSFHGRTYGAITATGQEKYQKGLTPLLPDIFHVPFNDISALESKMSEKTCGVFIEVIQGEGGVIPADFEYLKKVRELCDKYDALLIFDEVQTGVGRTGTLYAYQQTGVVPDAISSAKGLAGGVPIGALLATDKAAAAFKPGDHASTFGGNSLATSAGVTVIKEIMENGVLENVKKQGDYLTEKLNELKAKHSSIVDVRGLGLMKGIELDTPAAPIVSSCIEKGLLLVGAGEKVIRFVPPLIIEKEQIDEAISILDSVL